MILFFYLNSDFMVDFQLPLLPIIAVIMDWLLPSITRSIIVIASLLPIIDCDNMGKL